MNVRNLIGRIPERLVLGLAGLGGSVAIVGFPTFMSWWIRLWAPLFA